MPESFMPQLLTKELCNFVEGHSIADMQVEMTEILVVVVELANILKKKNSIFFIFISRIFQICSMQNNSCTIDSEFLYCQGHSIADVEVEMTEILVVVVELANIFKEKNHFFFFLRIFQICSKQNNSCTIDSEFLCCQGHSIADVEVEMTEILVVAVEFVNILKKK